MKPGDIKELTNEDIGQWFTYVPSHAPEDKSQWETGKLKSFNNETQTAFIVYAANDNWDGDHWKDYTAQSTRYDDLIKGRETYVLPPVDLPGVEL